MSRAYRRNTNYVVLGRAHRDNVVLQRIQKRPTNISALTPAIAVACVRYFICPYLSLFVFIYPYVSLFVIVSEFFVLILRI